MSAAPAPADAVARGDFDHVIVLSVDGLHAAVLAPPIVDGLPTFSRLLRGPHTLEARTDPDATITLPNHVSMITSAPLALHGWQWNDDPPALRHGGTIHARAGRYIPSAFDVAHDHGLSTALFAGKTKFWIFEQSYGAAGGAKDAVPPDHGRAKIDLVVYAERGGDLTAQCAARLHRAAREQMRTLDFLHLAEPDSAGHAHEWDLRPGSNYLESVALVDRWLGELLGAIDGDERLRGVTAIVLTTDHGGGKPEKTHSDITAPCNFVIPFALWLGSDRAPLDLYAINASTRTRPPADFLPGNDANPPPIRNGDAGNAALQLLGLPTISGSVHNARHDLMVEPSRAAPAAIPQTHGRSADDLNDRDDRQGPSDRPQEARAPSWNPTRIATHRSGSPRSRAPRARRASSPSSAR